MWTLLQLAFQVDLHSHILLIPLVSAYLVWSERRTCPPPGPANLAWTGLLALGVVGCAVAGLTSLGPASVDQRLALKILAYLSGIGLAVSVFLGAGILRFLAFPLGFLLFMVPVPEFLIQGFETLLQRASADVAEWIFVTTGLPSIRDGQFFRLPGLSIEVAQECSGVRSTLVLFIVAVLAARLFLRRAWKRILLVSVIIPLGIVRNAFRIYVLAALSVEVDPSIIKSPLHHQGGPVFFLLSLLPLGLLLWMLRRSERQLSAPEASRPALE